MWDTLYMIPIMRKQVVLANKQYPLLVLGVMHVVNQPKHQYVLTWDYKQLEMSSYPQDVILGVR